MSLGPNNSRSRLLPVEDSRLIISQLNIGQLNILYFFPFSPLHSLYSFLGLDLRAVVFIDF